jgi:lysozyme family protein
MARATLPRALELMFGHEGGYSNVKTDSGGPTKYGVTHKTLAAHRGVASVTADQVKALTLKEATDIYRTGYWPQSGGDLLPVGLDYAAFDFGVNSGPARSMKVLQEVLGVPADGNAGPVTLAAVERYKGGTARLIKDFCAARMDYLRSLKNRQTGFPVNGRGWTIRVTGIDPKGIYAPAPGVVGNALAMVSNKTVQAPQPAPAGGDAKAEPGKPNPWVKPETVMQGIGAAGGLSFLATGNGPVQWAVGAVLVVAAVIAAVFIIRRIRSTPA